MRKLKRIIVAAAIAGAAVGLFSLRAGSLPNPRSDTGRGEKLALVVGGSFATRAEAEAAAARWAAEEIDGFFVASSADFEAMKPGAWILVSAFRTKRGAEEFARLAAAAGFPETTQVIDRYRGAAYIGLGQEPHPDGSGPLTRPLPPGHPEWLG